MLRAILDKSWKQHTTKQHLHGHSSQKLPNKPCGTLLKMEGRSSVDSLTHERASIGRPARTYLHQLCADSICNLEKLLGVMDDRDGWKERVKEICAVSEI